MKTIIPIFAFSILSILNGQNVKQAEHISPEDFGAHKWNLSATAKQNEVVIFRATTIRERKERKDIEIYDSVHYNHSSGIESKQNVFFYDPDFFNMNKTEESNWYWKALGGTGWVRGEWKGSRTWTSKNRIEIYFESDLWGRTEKHYEVIVVPYKDAKELHPELPEIEENQGWVWSGFHPKSEPDGSGQ